MATSIKNATTNAVSSTESVDALIFDYSAAAPQSATLTGTGNESLKGSSSARDLFVGSSGRNTVVGYGSEDTIQFNYTGFSIIEGTDDVLLSGSGDSALVIKNGKGRALGITKTAGSAPSYAYYGGSYGGTQKTVIQNFMNALDSTEKVGTEALDEAVKSASGGKFETMSALISQATLDCEEHGSDTFLRDDCGIILNNADTGAITGWDAGGANTKTAISVVPESGKFGTAFSENSFTTNGLTFELEKNFSSLTDVQKRIWQGLKTWWAGKSLDLIAESYGTGFTFDKASVKKITVKFTTGNGFLAQVRHSYTDEDGLATALELDINMKYYKNTDLDDVNGKSDDATAGYLDRVISHELTHAIMASTINGFSKLPAYIKEGMAELTHGIDDERGNDITVLAKDAKKLSTSLSDATDASKVKASGVNAPSYAGGYILLKYMAKQSATFTANSGQAAASGAHAVTDDELVEAPKLLIYDKGKAKVTVTADYTDTSLSPTSASSLATTVTLIDATQATLSMAITGGPKAGTINIGTKGGTLIGGSTGADKLYGNTGADVFVYSVGGGSDVVGNTKDKDTMYTAADKIVIVDSSITADNAENYLGFKDAKSSLTLTFKGDKKSKLTINKDAAETPVTIELRSELGGSVLKTVTHNTAIDGVALSSNYATATVSSVASGAVIDASALNSQIKTIDATAATVPVHLIGNMLATSISLGSGGGTAQGGYDYVNDKGFDDKMYGGDGADVFVYSLGGGKDQINNFNGKTDKIVLQGIGDITTIPTTGDISYAEKGSNLVLTINGNGKKGTLTINNPNGQVKIYKDTDLNNPILENGVELPDYTGYNKNKTAVTLGASESESTAAASKTISIDLIGEGYSNGIKEIDASVFVGKSSLVGNGNANAIKSAIGGGTVDGGSGAKATGDKLYGNVGADTFIYKLTSVGGGTDVIGGDKKFAAGNYDTQDVVHIIDSTTALSRSDLVITDKADVVTVKFNSDKKSQLTINKASSDTAVKFILEGKDSAMSQFTHGEIPTGVGYGLKGGKIDYTTLTVGGAASNSTINTSEIHSQIKNIDMLEQTTGAVYVVGNDAANAITLGAAGGTVDGGAGNDKIFGNTTASGGITYMYTVGEGNDEINGYNGSKDSIVINGYSTAIDTSNSKMFKDSGKDITITLPNATTNKSGKLTIKNTNGQLTILGRDTDNNVIHLLDYGKNLPDSVNMGFNSNKTIMTIGGGAQLGSENTFKLNDYGINLKELDASAYSTTSLHLIGSNTKASIIHAGAKGSTLEGAHSGADKLYGNDGIDSFVYNVTGNGKDEIYSLNGAQGDEIILLGYTGTAIDTSKKTEFDDNGKDITLSFTGGGKLTVKAPTGQLKVYSGTKDETTGAITKSEDAVLTYDSNLPKGVEYNANKTAITLGSAIEGHSTSYEINASKENAYSVKLTTINASAYTGSVNLVGNSNNNVIYSSKAASTIDGGAGADKLYGTSKVKDTFVYNIDGSKDQVFNYDYADGGDVIRINGSNDAVVKATYNGKTLVLTCEDKDGNRNVTGTLTINGIETGTNKYANIDTTTKVAIQIGEGTENVYLFQNNKTKNVKLTGSTDSDAKIYVNQDPSTETTTADQQLSGAEDYWFIQSDGVDELSKNDELKSIMEIAPMPDNAVDLEDFSEINKKIVQNLGANAMGRRKLKK